MDCRVKPGKDICYFFTQGHNQGDAEAARQYLAWEIALVDRLDDQERATFRIAAGPQSHCRPRA